MKNILKNSQGQGLIEVIIAIAVISVGLFAVLTLFASNFNGEQEAKARVVGVNLAREGVEAVKNIRDSNWLHGDENQYDENNFLWRWDHNLMPGTYIISDLFSTSTPDEYDGMIDLVAVSLPNDVENTRLYIDGDGFFTNEATNKFSGYRRIITIKNICCNSEFNDGSETEEHVIKEECASQEFVLADGACATGFAKVGIDVQSEVNWKLNDKSRKAVIEDQLFDWR